MISQGLTQNNAPSTVMIKSNDDKFYTKFKTNNVKDLHAVVENNAEAIFGMQSQGMTTLSVNDEENNGMLMKQHNSRLMSPSSINNMVTFKRPAAYFAKNDT